MMSNEVIPEWPAFPTRLMALPAVSDAFDLAVNMYTRSKDYRVVGVALNVAEGTLKSAVTVAAPFATPLLGYVDHLKPLDNWACRRLDDVERIMPTITKPTEEMLSATKHGVLVTVAGSDEPPPTLSAALSTRATSIATTVKDQAAAATIALPHRLLDTAHALLDHYLPEERSTEQQSDERDDGVLVKTLTLATKTSRRLCRTAHYYLHASCPLDPTPSHLAMECMQIVRRRCPRGLRNVGQRQQQQQPVRMLLVLMFVLPLRLSMASARILLLAVSVIFEELNALRMRMVSGKLLQRHVQSNVLQ